MVPILRRAAVYGFGWVTVRIRSGPLKGRMWDAVTGIRFVRGSYEPDQVKLFEGVVNDGDVVYDVGAHVGYYSVLASALVGPGGRVIAFEPLPANLHHLRRHLRINGCDNVAVIEACVGERPGRCPFRAGRGTGTGHVCTDGELSVDMVSLDGLVRDGGLPAPDVMKIDVEGSELAVLQGAESLITVGHPTILLSVHGDAHRRRCTDFLRAHGYRLRPIDERPLSEARTILATGRPCGERSTAGQRGVGPGGGSAQRTDRPGVASLRTDAPRRECSGR